MEVKSSNINKGRASVRIFGEEDFKFVFAIGDDWTDEFMFQELPNSAITVKVGLKKTNAKFHVEGTGKVRDLLKKLYRK